MTRNEKVKFCIKAVEWLEGVTPSRKDFEEMSEESLNDEVEWFSNLLNNK